MKINSLWASEVGNLLEFNENNGKYEKKIGGYIVELNSWNNKLFIKEYYEGELMDVPIELIKLIVDINNIRKIEFEKLEEEDYE